MDMDRPGDEGQMTLDFLLGLVIFLMAVAYLVTAIPGVFLPYQNNAVDLSSVVYRTSALLVEDPGYYIPNGTHLGFTGWEFLSPANMTGNLSRIGLASSKNTPDTISIKKINALRDNVTYKDSRDKLGLNNTVPYHYSLVINWTDSNGIEHSMTKPNATEATVPVGSNVETIQRTVFIDEGRGLLVNTAEDFYNTTDNHVGALIFNVTKNQTYENLNVTIHKSVGLTIVSIKLFNDSFPLTPPDHYRVYVDGTEWANYLVAPTSAAGQDVVIVLNGTWIREQMGPGRNEVDVTILTNRDCFRQTWDNEHYTFDESNPRYWSIYDKGVLKLKVWS